MAQVMHRRRAHGGRMNDEHPRPTTPVDRPTPAEVDQTQPIQTPTQVRPIGPPTPEAQPIGPPTPHAQPIEPPTRSSTSSEQPGFRDRIWSLRTIAAAAITAVALSGAGGAALASVSNGGNDDRGGFGRGGFGPPGRVKGQIPGQVNGQVPGQIPGQTNQQLPAQPRTNTVPRQQPSASAGATGRGRTT